MRPRRTIESSGVLHLPGGNEDSDLWYAHGHTDGGVHVFCTTWEFTPEEREQIMQGMNLELAVFGDGHPPVSLKLTDVQLGKRKEPR